MGTIIAKTITITAALALAHAPARAAASYPHLPMPGETDSFARMLPWESAKADFGPLLPRIPFAPQPPPVTTDERVDLAPLRELYLASVRDSRAIGRGMDEIARLRARTSIAAGSPLDATLTAYQGALVTLRAKHAFWPAQKLRHLRQGLAILDRTVAAHPDHAEARYLRLMSCYYLPGILGRGGSVRDDFAALARLLPGVRAQYPRPLYEAIARFVMERGRLSAEQRGALEDSIEQGDG